jgi:glutamate synthase domain-containing protein 3
MKMVMRIDCKGLYYRKQNKIIRDAAEEGETEFILDNANGQRYIGNGIEKNIKITVNGVPGNDLAMFMNGPTIIVNANAQDGVANTMNAGEVIVHGSAGDVIGYGMRGGKLYVRGNIGYRAGIHAKEYKKQIPIIIAGGVAGDFCGEYMAGGVLVLLGLNRGEGVPIAGNYLGTGMHGGVIYIRGEVDEYTLGKEVSVLPLDKKDLKVLTKHLKEYCEHFGLDLDEIMAEPFIKLQPLSNRPYGSLYAY